MSLNKLRVLLIIVALSSSRLFAQIAAPLEQRQFATLTSYDELQGFLQEIRKLPGMTVEHIAQSVQGRNISLVSLTSTPPFGSDKAKLRILFFAQQHGDEPSGKEAMTLLLAKAANGRLTHVLKRIDLLVVPQMNPDGSEAKKRRTADTIDLNRNHVLLTSPATKALHDVFSTWMPHVTMDIHEYGSFSTEWSDSGFIKRGDVQLGMLTNLNTSKAVRELQHERIFPFIAQRMEEKGFSFHEYIVGNPGMYVRHSTTEINDGRQSLGILGSVSFIQEGRKWKTIDDQLRRRVLSQLASAEALLECCSAYANEIRTLVGVERRQMSRLAGEEIPIRMDHTSSGKEMFIPVHMVKNEIDTLWRIRPYRDEVRLLKSITLPAQYVVPRNDTSVIALLRRHRVTLDVVRNTRTARGKEYVVDSVGLWVMEEDTLPFVSVTQQEVAIRLAQGDVLVSTNQLQARLIAILLEPESQWGLTKYDHFAYLRKEKVYPIKRIPK